MTVFLIIAGLILAFALGRSSKPTQTVKFFNAQLEANEKAGYRFARIKVGPGLDDVLLALHRQEGMLGAIRDNADDIRQAVNNFGAQDEKDANASE